jgi:hypothetical protein
MLSALNVSTDTPSQAAASSRERYFRVGRVVSGFTLSFPFFGVDPLGSFVRFPYKNGSYRNLSRRMLGYTGMSAWVETL